MFNNAFPGYEFKTLEDGKLHNMYRGTDLGKGGYVYAEPGMYGNVALLDIASLHPHSIIAMNCFGEYTSRFKDLMDARIYIKHKDYDSAKKILNGALAPYLDDPSQAKALAGALKTAINSVYGLTSATFENPFNDPRNKNNIVALRGALFMRTLQDEVQKRGFKVAHIKTDSIKIPDATPEIVQFCMDFAKGYGYEFEFEALYDRMCLVNDAVYIAKYASKEQCIKIHNFIPEDNEDHPEQWTATGTQFQIPYVFKKLFSKEDIKFEDMCETKSVTSALYLDMNEELTGLTSSEEKELDELDRAWHSQDDGKALEVFMQKYKYDAEYTGGRYHELCDKYNSAHDYHFIGRVGQFCPIKPGCGGGLLCREMVDKKTGETKYAAATGSKGYRWLESDMVKSMHKEADIDRGYYEALVNDAVDTIVAYGDYTWFVSDDPYKPPSFENGEYMLHPVYLEELPWN